MSGPRLYCQHQFRRDVFREYELRSTTVRVGSRHPDADVVLESNFIPPCTAELHLEDSSWVLQASCTGIVTLGAATLERGDRQPIFNRMQFRLHEWLCELRLPDKRAVAGPRQAEVASELLKDVQSALLRQKEVDLRSRRDEERQNASYLEKLEAVILDLVTQVFSRKGHPADVIRFVAGEAVRSELLAESSRSEGNSSGVWDHDEPWMRFRHGNLAFENELSAIVRHLEPRLRSETTTVTDMSEILDLNFEPMWQEIQISDETLWYLCRRQYVKQMKDILFGFGPLEDLLRTPAVSEIMVVDSEHIYIERSGVVQDSGRRFISDEITVSIIERIVDKVGRQINKSRPLVDARLSDGSRVNAVIPPLAVTGPCLTIRKFPTQRLRLRDLEQKGAMTESVRKFLEAAVSDHRNILISGGTGTGKTTLLNGLSDVIDPRERVVTVEDTAELQIGQEHVISLESKQANTEGQGAYSIRDLVRNALRMRPDRIVVGECRGPEALDMLQAMNTGHDGSMTTIHANTPRDVIARLEVLVQAGNDVNLPVSSIYQQITSAIDLIVQLTRFPDGRRMVTQVTEVTGIDSDGEVKLRDLFVMGTKTVKKKKVEVSGTEDDGQQDEIVEALLVPTGRLPTFIQRISDNGGDSQFEDHRGFARKLDLASFYV